MVNEQLRARGLADTAVLTAMGTVPRECFVPASYQSLAYADAPLPIPCGQSISQPYIVAYMISLLSLKVTDHVLDIGTGSGYAAAVLGCIVQEVHSVERHEPLVRYASQRLSELGYDNVHVHLSDGTLGWPEQAPYNAILVSAGGPSIPHSLCQQLAVNGRLVMPVGPQQQHQTLTRVTRNSDTKFSTEKQGSVAFVPLIGVEGWLAETDSAPDDDLPGEAFVI